MATPPQQPLTDPLGRPLTRACPVCGTQVALDAPFCPACGTSLRSGRGPTGPMIVAGLLAIVVGVLLALLLTKGDDNDTPLVATTPATLATTVATTAVPTAPTVPTATTTTPTSATTLPSTPPATTTFPAATTPPVTTPSGTTTSSSTVTPGATSITSSP